MQPVAIEHGPVGVDGDRKVGLVGLGGYIDFKELAQAGGAPLKVGLVVGVTKYVLALLVVLLIRDYLVEI